MSAAVPPAYPAFARNLIESRQLAHVEGLDIAYETSYRALRAAAFAAGGGGNQLLGEAHGTYVAFRRILLREKLLAAVAGATVDSSGAFNYADAGARFGLDTCGALDAPVALSAPAEADVSDGGRAGYAQWRRALASRRFENRRAAVETDLIRSLAVRLLLLCSRRGCLLPSTCLASYLAPPSPRPSPHHPQAAAMSRAVLAEAQEREEFESLRRSLSTATPLDSRERAEFAAAAAASSRVWKRSKTLDIGGELADPFLMSTLVGVLDATHGIGGMSALRAAVRSADSAGAANAPTSKGAALRMLLGDKYSALIAGHAITAISFSKDHPDLFAAATDGGSIHLISASTGIVWAVATGHEGAVSALDWASADGSTFLVSASIDKSVRLWFVTCPTVTQGGGPDASSHMDESTSADAAGGRGEARGRTLQRGDATQRGSVGQSLGQRRGARASRLAARASSESSLSRTPAERAKAAREEEKQAAASEIAAERNRGRVAAAAAAGPTADGGGVECVAVIATDYPLTHVAFCPLNPSLVVVAGLEESDYRELCETSSNAPQSSFDASEDFDLTAEADAESMTPSANAGFGAGFGGFKNVTSKMGAALKTGLNKALKGTVDGLVAVAQATTNVVTLGGAIPLPASGLILSAGVIASGGIPRGHLMVFDAVAGRQLAARRVQGSIVNPSTLAKEHSAATALVFAPDGETLYLACGRGMLHAYDVETDAEAMATCPLKDHRVIYGEVAAGALVGGLRKLKNAFDDLGANLGLDVDDAEGTVTAGAPKPYFSRLFFKHDIALNAPIFLALDSNRRIRAFNLPVERDAFLEAGPTLGAGAADDEFSRAAIAGLGAAAKASVALVTGTIAVGTLGTLQVNSTPQAAELQGFINYVERGPGVHTLLAPLHQSDQLIAATPWADTFLLAPHGAAVGSANNAVRPAPNFASCVSSYANPPPPPPLPHLCPLSILRDARPPSVQLPLKKRRRRLL